MNRKNRTNPVRVFFLILGSPHKFDSDFKRMVEKAFCDLGQKQALLGDLRRLGEQAVLNFFTP